jgi:hypothetical protein
MHLHVLFFFRLNLPPPPSTPHTLYFFYTEHTLGGHGAKASIPPFLEGAPIERALS